MTRHTAIGRALCLLLLLFTSGAAMAQTAEYKYINQGNRRFAKGDYKGAAAFYRKALKANPNNARATFNMADCYLAEGKPQEADSLYQRVVQTEHNNEVRAMAWHNRGYICQRAALEDQEKQQQLLREAIEHYKQALRLNPRDNDTRYNLALCQKQLKDNPDQNKKDQQKQQQKQQQQQKEQEKKDQQQQDKQQQQQPQNKDAEQERRQTEQYINLAKQAEKRALQRVKAAQPRKRSLQKNW